MVDLEIDESKVWSPEKRQEYIDNLPEMSLFDDHILEGDVMIDAMQALVEEGETAESLAMHYKAKGNEMFQDGKKRNPKYYKNALKYYEDAISYANIALNEPSDTEKYSINELLGQIYSNRAAVHLILQNYGIGRSDVAKAIKHDPKNLKAYFRGAKASQMLRKPEDTLRYCQHGLAIDPHNPDLKKLNQSAQHMIHQIETDRREREKRYQQKRQSIDSYRNLCQKRKIRMGRSTIQDIRIQKYQGTFRTDDTNNEMIWAVLFLYEEHRTSDFVETFAESDSFLEHLANMFPEDGPFCDWDTNSSYKASNLVLYARANAVPSLNSIEEWYNAFSVVEDLQLEKVSISEESEWIEIPIQTTLLQLLSHELYVIPGIPVIYVYVRNSEAHKAHQACIRKLNRV